MKTTLTLVALAVALSSSAFASEASDKALVLRLADKVMSGSDVRKTVSTYNNTDSNPCAPSGISYLVTVEIRKSKLKMNEKEEVVQAREWEEFNTLHISQADLAAGKRELSDAICQE